MNLLEEFYAAHDSSVKPATLAEDAMTEEE
jgi:hypothetical protein